MEMMDQPDTGLITQIADDIATHAPFNAYADRMSDTLDAGYDIQDQVAAMLQARGIRAAPCGYKLAVNAQHLMAHFALSAPCFGRLFSDQKWQSPAQLSAADYSDLWIEVEIMAVMARDLPPRPGGHDRASAEAAVALYLPAIELVDARGLEIATARLSSVVAQNITTEGIVVGGPGLAPAALEVATLPVRLTFDGQVVGETTGTAPQHPGDALAALANHLGARGGMLKAGDVVICGTHLPPPSIGGAGHVVADMGPLGTVEFTIS
ncbi:MAG: hypothetical protein COC12_10785 [Rhodobacteraceae bacterium]|nr:MAG: hypothetical protein COC12_10785 [Paracoccaceae bacterium]